MSPAFRRLVCFTNLLESWRTAARGKRRTASVARFEHEAGDELIALQHELASGSYRPRGYRHFQVHAPKRRLISAACFRDRVVHHALCRVIVPRFEQVFIPDSYANRPGKGTHRAVDRFQELCRRYRYVLRLDVEQHFPSIDHEILLGVLRRKIPEEDVMHLVEVIVAGGAGVLDRQAPARYFPGDDLLALLRPRGLPIGNLTSQFWSNCYLHGLDLLVKRELGFAGYLRYVDDSALFSDSKDELRAARTRIVERLAALRLRIHERSAQVAPCASGSPWLGFVIYPGFRRVKGRCVRHGTRRLRARYRDWLDGRISGGELLASVDGWMNHVAHADSAGLRRHLRGACLLDLPGAGGIDS